MFVSHEQYAEQYLKTLAEFLRRDLESENPVRQYGAIRSLARIQPHFRDMTVEEIRRNVRHSDFLDVVALEKGYTSWRAVKQGDEPRASFDMRDARLVGQIFVENADLSQAGWNEAGARAVLARMDRETLAAVQRGVHSTAAPADSGTTHTSWVAVMLQEEADPVAATVTGGSQLEATQELADWVLDASHILLTSEEYSELEEICREEEPSAVLDHVTGTLALWGEWRVTPA